MDLKQLRSFVAVVDCRSFTRAAEKLYLSQPTISTHIRMLEEEFSASFIVRTTKSIEVTPRGMELYDCARNMLALQDNLLRHWSAQDRPILQLGASTIPSAYILPELLPAYRLQQSDVLFDIRQSDSQGVIDGLLSGNLEVGLTGSASRDSALSFFPFYRDTMVLITPASGRFLALKERGDGIHLDDLIHEPFILRERGSGSKKSVDAYFARAGIREEELLVTARLNDQEAVKSLVASGLGLSIISAKAAEGLERTGRLLTFSLPGMEVTRNLYVCCRKNDFLPPHVQKFIAFVRQFYSAGTHLTEQP